MGSRVNGMDTLALMQPTTAAMDACFSTGSAHEMVASFPSI